MQKRRLILMSVVGVILLLTLAIPGALAEGARRRIRSRPRFT